MVEFFYLIVIVSVDNNVDRSRTRVLNQSAEWIFKVGTRFFMYIVRIHNHENVANFFKQFIAFEYDFIDRLECQELL